MTSREQRNAGTETRQSNNSVVITQGPISSSRDIHNNISLSSAGGGWNDHVDPPDFNQLKLGLCWPLPQFYVNSPLLKPLHKHAWTLSLKLPHFSYSGRHCFGKDPQCSPYLLQVINPSLSWYLAWLYLLAWHPSRGEPSFRVTTRQALLSPPSRCETGGKGAGHNL